MADVAHLFPSYVASVELHTVEAAEPLYPEEQAHIARAVDKRKNEFALGRTCARRALEQLGVPPLPLPARENRAVAWPEAAWGSITHADNFCAAVAALRSHVRGIGLDAEVRTRVHRKLWKQIAGASEVAWLDSARDESEQLLHAALLFSAKESFYKAQFCATEAWVGFHDAAFSLLDGERFEIKLLVDVADTFGQGTRFVGRYAVLDEHVVTGLVIEP
jgi:4'-phosphopantetheinyl transferase EntD